MTEHDNLRAEVVRLRLALRGLLRETEDYEHHPEECPRSSACEEPGEQGCRRCKSYDCPDCECGLAETLRAIAAARAALAGSPVETRRPSASLALHDRALAERVREACVKAISVPRRSIAWSPQIEGLVNDLRALDLDALLEKP